MEKSEIKNWKQLENQLTEHAREITMNTMEYGETEKCWNSDQ